MNRRYFPLLLAILSSPAPLTHADVILQPVGVTGSVPAFISNPYSQLIDQSGLSATYTDGVTDFDTFVAATMHDGGLGRGESNSDSTGNLDFDLGSLQTIESFALWNRGGNADANIIGFNLIGDDDGDFGNGGNTTLLSAQSADPFTGPGTAVEAEIFSFTPTAVSSVRLEITSNNGSSYFGLGEVAFKQSAAASAAVPEPGSTLLLSLGVLGFGYRRYYRQQLRGVRETTDVATLARAWSTVWRR